MEFQSINPYNNQVLETFHSQTDQEVNAILNSADEAFKSWKNSSFAERSKVLSATADILTKNIEQYARTITLEMGKPLAESMAEVKKCAWVCEYYAQNAENFLNPQVVKTDAKESYITMEPIGCVLAIMPWNFPFWQVFRFAAPAIMAGNVGVLKHAPNVFRCALLIEEAFTKAGCPKGVFQNLIIHHDNIEAVIENEVIKAVTLTGSERAGSSVAQIAGKNIKKTVLELGGSNAFIVCEDADIDKAVEVGVKARMLNAGQSCIAAKRFFVVEKVYDEFVKKYLREIQKLKQGDPMESGVNVGPLARKDLADQLHRQVTSSIEMGAELLTGGVQQEASYEPTVLTNITTEMPVFYEETFGPVTPLMKVKTEDEAFDLAAQTKFGLGITVFTEDRERAKKHIPKVADGAFFINDLVKSDPRLPFGGTKYSGYGRELSKEGILEFVNKKTVYIM